MLKTIFRNGIFRGGFARNQRALSLWNDLPESAAARYNETNFVQRSVFEECLPRLGLDPAKPTAILDLTSLRLVDFNHNELVHMPLEIAKLPKLVGLDLRNNAIANIPEQVMVTARSGTAESVRAKLQERRAVQGHE